MYVMVDTNLDRLIEYVLVEFHNKELWTPSDESIHLIEIEYDASLLKKVERFCQNDGRNQ